ncbi:MAG TPA: TonB family protein [Candidatus Acidoferrales bacterium]|nr:TonB family protein [Candidatus Acidoferrales bacterium]
MNWRLLWDNFVTYNLQIGLLIGLAAFIPTLIRLRMPRARLAFWQILLAACLLLPFFAPRREEPVASPAPVVDTPLPNLPAPPATKRTIPTGQVAFLVLAAGIAARLAWLSAGFWRLRRYRILSRPLEPALSWGVEADLRLSGDVASPVTFGFRKPVVLLPAHFPELEPHMQDAVLCHEILHVRRGDWLFTLSEELVRGIFWYHPAVWWLLGEIGLAREQAVDHEVIELTKSRDGYLDALLAIAGANPQLDLAPAPLFLRKRHLKQRVVSILKEVGMSKTRRISALAAGLTFLAAACWFVTATLPLSASPQAVADGPGVTVDLGGAAVLHRPGVMYPATALRDHVQGVVTVEATLDSAGNVADAHVISGPQELRRAALQSVLQWHFANDNATLTRRVNIAFSAPQEPAPQSGVIAGVVGGVPGGVAGGIVGGVPGTAPAPAMAARKGAAAPPSIAGKTLTGYTVMGLTDQARSDLLARLPVHQGDTLAEDSFDSINKAVHDYDEHLTVARTFSREGDIRIMIMAPGASTVARESVLPPPPNSDPNIRRITIGGNVQQTKLISQARPAYPPLAKQARIQGVVQLQALIGIDGAVKNLQVIGGHPLLVEAALEAVQQWVYQPTLLNGQPVEVLTQIDVNFTLSQ